MRKNSFKINLFTRGRDYIFIRLIAIKVLNMNRKLKVILIFLLSPIANHITVRFFG